jgi:hypothetical protein
MICSCGNEDASKVRIVYGEDGGRIECCDKCGQLDNSGCEPDVFFREPYFDEHLGNKVHPHGQWVFSKRHKARLLKEQGLVESGDRIHGSRRNYEGPDYGMRNVRR